jgi:coenzyme F420-reducing hydrogenase delta subunit
MFDTVCKITQLLGIEKERLHLVWISSSEGIRFAETARDFTQKIQELGRLNLIRAA